MGFEPTRGDPNGLAVHRLNHSATSSEDQKYVSKDDKCYFHTILWGRAEGGSVFEFASS